MVMTDAQTITDWPAWAMISSWLGAVVDNLREEGCLSKETANAMRKDLIEGVTLITEAVSDGNTAKLNMGKDIVVSAMKRINKAVNDCNEGGDNA
jgi:polyhydroxyalkanoate synthesis regulator phasin